MDKQSKPGDENLSLLEAMFPTEAGLADSITESKTLLIMIVVACILFGGLALFLVKMASMQ